MVQVAVAQAVAHAATPLAAFSLVSRLDHALGHKQHTMTENLHALSAHGPQFPGTLDLTGCSDVVVLELRHHRCIRRRWRPSEPLRLPSRHRPLHVQTRLVQPPAQTPLVLMLQVVQAYSALFLALSSGSPPTEIRQ